MKIIKKCLTLLLMTTLSFNIFNLSTFAEEDGFDKCRKLSGMVHDNLSCYFEEAKDKIKSGASRVTIQNEKNIPNYRLEFFRYTALDEIVPNLPFETDEKKWNEIIKSKYANTFNSIKMIGAGTGALIGALSGLLYVKVLSHIGNKSVSDKSDENVNTQRDAIDTNKKPIRDNKLTYLVSAILGSGIFTFLGKIIVGGKISEFENQKLKELKIEKENALSVMKSIKTFIENGIWKHGNCLCIQLCKDSENGDSTVHFVDVDNNRLLDGNPLDLLYSENEKKHFPQAFKKLKQDLEIIMLSKN